MRSIGGFDPNTFLFFEENILFEKIRGSGKRNYLVPSLKCIHLGASTTSKNVSLRTQFASMNSARYYLENYCGLTMFQRLLMSISFLNMRMKIKIKNILC